jgi:hypothetical protein
LIVQDCRARLVWPSNLHPLACACPINNSNLG